METYQAWIVFAFGVAFAMATVWDARQALKSQRLRWQIRLDEALTEQSHLLDHVHGLCQCSRYCPPGQVKYPPNDPDESNPQDVE